MEKPKVIGMTMTPEEDLRSRLHLHLSQDGGNPSHLLEMLEHVVKTRVWESFGMTFLEFVETPFKRHGLGWSRVGLKSVMYLRHRYEDQPEIAKRMQDLRQALTHLSEGSLAPHSTDMSHVARAIGEHGRPSAENKKDNNYNVSTLEIQGTDPTYLTARIARDRPDILEDMKAGKYRSVRAAAIEAGIIDPDKSKRYSLPTDPVKAAAYLLERVDGDWLAEFLAELMT